jgi:iron complex outermembrane recepter protein
MRFKTLIRSAASIGVIVACASGVHAQEVLSPPTTTAPQAAQPDEPIEAEPETVVVTGIRASLRSAQGTKRVAVQIIDSIVAQDIGKLPDVTVSETAARIPGLQADRVGGEASRILVRGLPDFSTTYNGREIFTAETRTVALQDFPSANIAGLEVYKSSTANLVEPGLAGLINVRSRRPFDFPGFQVAGSFWAVSTKQAGEVNPSGNILVSNRWEVDGQEFGLLINASYNELDYLDSEPSNTDFIADPVINGQAVRLPDIQRLFYRSGNRVRPSVNAAAQWRPNENLDLFAEVLWQGFRNKIDDRLAAVPLYGGQSYTNLVLRPGTNQVSSGTVVNQGDPIFTFQGGTFNQTDTYQFAAGGQYESGPLLVKFDIARTDTEFTGSTESVDRIFAGRQTIDFDLETPQFQLRNFDAANPANYFFDGLYEENQRSAGSDWQVRVDAEYEFDDASFIRKAQVGVRYTDRDAIREFGNRFAGFRGRNIPSSSLPLTFEVFRAGFRGTDVQSGFNTFLSPTYDSIRANRTALRQFVIDNGPFGGFGTFTLDAPAMTRLYTAEEQTLAAYGQVEYAIGEKLDGVIGLRAVHTKSQVVGEFVSGIEGRDEAQDYTDWLPNISLRYRILPELQFRLSATQTRTKPSFADLNPSLVLGAVDPTDGIRRGGGGNPSLKPFTSNNYDASLEYYFSGTGFVAATAFRRDLDGFIQTQATRFTDPVLGLIELRIPINTGEGKIEGVEIQGQAFADFESLPAWARGFGVQANMTVLTAKTGFPNASGEVVLDRILGVSKVIYNAALIYEYRGFSSRLSYNGRGKFLDQRQDRGDDFYTEEGVPAPRLDFSASYAFNDNYTFFLDWTNILEDPYKVNLSSARGGAPRADYVRFLRYEESTISGGVRFRF